MDMETDRNTIASAIQLFLNNFISQSANSVHWLDSSYTSNALCRIDIYNKNQPEFHHESSTYAEFKAVMQKLNMNNIIYLTYHPACQMIQHNLFILTWHGQCKVNQFTYGFRQTQTLTMMSVPLIQSQIFQVDI